MIRGCTVIAIDGTHASGKSTLVHALTAHYRRAGINAVAMPEPARSSPYMEDVVLHGRGEFDLPAEIDVFAAHLRAQVRLARNHRLLIADKTIINVLAYARMLLDLAEPHTADVLDAMEGFCRAWAHTYDMVLFTHDRYDQPADTFRSKVDGLQDTAATTLHELYSALGVPVHEVPLNLETTARVEWIAGRVAETYSLDAR